jgi:hypothetical protein
MTVLRGQSRFRVLHTKRHGHTILRWGKATPLDFYGVVSTGGFGL